MEKETPEFVDGLIVKDSEQDFILLKMSIKREELIAWLQAKEGDWINLDIKRSKKTDKPYAQVNTWKPTGGYEQTVAKKVDTASIAGEVFPDEELGF